MVDEDLSIYPGGDLVAKGLADLADDRLSEEALLLLVAGPRLRDLGFEIPLRADLPRPIEHTLYSEIENRMPGGGAHLIYNSLIQRIVSFANAYRPADPSPTEFNA